MCGIVAIICKDPRGLYAFDRDIFEEMCIADSVRGDDSTGVFSVSMQNEIHIVKQAIDPITFFRHASYKEWADKISGYRAIIGHNRKASSGAITSQNAHPFKEGDIVLVHNGMLFSHKDLNKEVDVDSHALCHGFAEKGAKETLKEVNGAFALIWYNIKTKELFLWRNEERPLAIVETSVNMYVASELDMIKWILKREKRQYQIEKETIVEPNLLYKITLHPFKLEKESLSKSIFIPTHRERYPSNTDYGCSPEIEDPVPEWLHDEIKDIKAANDNIKQVNPQEIRAKYPFDSRVLFQFEGLRSYVDIPKKYEIKGKIFLPGGPIVNGFIYTAQGTTLPIIKSWRDSKKIIGTVGTILGLRDGSITMHLNNNSIEIPDKVVLWNKTVIPRLEWELICKTNLCRKCNKEILPQQADFTSVNERKLGEYSVVCAACISDAIPKDKRQKLLPMSPIEGVNEQNVVDALKGNTHGS